MIPLGNPDRFNAARNGKNLSPAFAEMRPGFGERPGCLHLSRHKTGVATVDGDPREFQICFKPSNARTFRIANICNLCGEEVE